MGNESTDSSEEPFSDEEDGAAVQLLCFIVRSLLIMFEIVIVQESAHVVSDNRN